MDIQQLLESLNEDQRAVINTAINNEKNIGISKYQTKDKEALKLRGRLKDLGYDSEKYKDFDEFATEIKGTKPKLVEQETTLASLNETLKKLQLDISNEKQAKEEAVTKNNKQLLIGKLEKSFGDKLYGSKFLINDIVNNGDYKIDNDNITFGDTDYEAYVTSILDDNKSNLIATPNAGGNNNVVTNEPIAKSSFLTKVLAEQNKE